MKIVDKEAFTKAMFWRLVISIPLGTLITFLFLGEVFQVVALVITMNIIMTIAHYLFEIAWPKIWKVLAGERCRDSTVDTEQSTTNTSTLDG